MVTNGNKISESEYDIVYTDVELQCCTPETYIILLANILKK